MSYITEWSTYWAVRDQRDRAVNAYRLIAKIAALNEGADK